MTPQEQRFWARVSIAGPDECWEWQKASRLREGYGRLSWGGQVVSSNRLAFELTYGPLPSGLFALHTCDNPPCCNPAHLYAGTKRDNTQDMIRKGRYRGGIKKGGRQTEAVRLNMSAGQKAFLGSCSPEWKSERARRAWVSRRANAALLDA